ncbi:signal recognition particle subunit SRP54-like [Oppia nitens]|uniref:signal recognition particle subunit SRP54-like n=1 Tax=Oppia nitens TaxID=1686743 RepID=UPI0023DA70F1|nr:signal recognition particle subunit SRP54-like [Oppia nitens]
MLKLSIATVLLLSLVLNSYGWPQRGGGGGGMGSRSWPMMNNNGMTMGGNGGGGGGGGGMGDMAGMMGMMGGMPLAVLSQRDIAEIPVQSQGGPIEPTVLDIQPVDLPVQMNWMSQSSTLDIAQRHFSRPGSVQQDQVMDEPHRMIQQVLRPIVQDVREIIVPARNVIQQILPVQENVQTVLARGQGGRGSGMADAMGGMAGGGNGMMRGMESQQQTSGTLADMMGMGAMMGAGGGQQQNMGALGGMTAMGGMGTSGGAGAGGWGNQWV